MLPVWGPGYCPRKLLKFNVEIKIKMHKNVVPKYNYRPPLSLVSLPMDTDSSQQLNEETCLYFSQYKVHSTKLLLNKHSMTEHPSTLANKSHKTNNFLVNFQCKKSYGCNVQPCSHRSATRQNIVSLHIAMTLQEVQGSSAQTHQNARISRKARVCHETK